MSTHAARAGLPAGVLDPLRADRVEARNVPVSPASVEDVRAAGWRIDDLWLPAVVLHTDPLTHNLARFAGWCAERGLSHAPHGKTTMAPQLWSAQFAHGAWALSAATVDQTRVMHRFGVRRVLIANEVVDPGQLRWLAGQLTDPEFEPCCLVDDAATAARMEDILADEDAPRLLPVLVELGVPGRRTGVRGVSAALELAERVARSPRLTLAGVEGYEGVLTKGRDPEVVAAARAYLAELTGLAVDCDRRGLFDAAREVIVTAGGSAYVDLAADAFAAMPPLSRPLRPVVRSGCYLTHDHLLYEYTSALRSSADTDPLQPALAGYARVLSCPEPGRALLGAGRRDVPFDATLPVPRRIHRGDSVIDVDGRATLVELNDHHAFCDHEPGLFQVGDVVELALAHPCTAFDKWPLVPVADSAGRVVDAVRTLF